MRGGIFRVDISRRRRRPKVNAKSSGEIFTRRLLTTNRKPTKTIHRARKPSDIHGNIFQVKHTEKRDIYTLYKNLRNMRRIYIDRYNYALRLSSFFFFIFLSRFLFFSFVACRSKRFHTNQSKTVNFFKTDLLNQENKSRSPSFYYCPPPPFTSACCIGYLFRFLTT